MKIHGWKDSLETGEYYEKVLDEKFQKFYHISDGIQKDGIDRVFVDRDSGITYTVEYKSDIAASNTKNAFIETISVDTYGKLGWALTTKSQIIVYYIVKLDIIYQISTVAIKVMLPKWIKIYKKASVSNKNYKSYGIPVPLSELKKYHRKILRY